MAVAGLCLSLAVRSWAAEPERKTKQYAPAQDEFVALEKAVVALFKSRDAAQFAREMTATIEDYRAVFSTNQTAEAQELLKGIARSTEYERNKVQASAKALLERADALHLDFSKGDLQAKANVPNRFGERHWGNPQEKGESVPWTEQVELVLLASPAPSNAIGEFKVVLRGMLKFPAGWRSYDGIQWEAVPAGIADEKTLRELALLQKVGRHQSFNDKEDPALRKLGEVLVRFIRERDEVVFEKEACFNTDMIWRQFEKSGRQGPSRKEVDEEMGRQIRDQIGVARAALKLIEVAGVDLKHADVRIETAAIERSQAQGSAASLDCVIGTQFTLKLAVKTEGKSSSGAALSGDYVLAAKSIMRIEDEWRVMDGLRWQQLPPGVLSEKAVATMELENFVAAHGSLPTGKPAPEIEFTSLIDEKKTKLSDLRGKVVVLDFWATWCGPCQSPMAELQKIRAGHPDWGDRVALLALSIDDTLQAVRGHVDKRGWTNTFNVWAGNGGWRSPAAKAFRVTGVPTTYILDEQGKIIRAGHPAGMRIAEEVDSLVRAAKARP